MAATVQPSPSANAGNGGGGGEGSEVGDEASFLEIKNLFIDFLIHCWIAEGKKIEGYAHEVIGVGYELLLKQGQGCLKSHPNGGYVHIPYSCDWKRLPLERLQQCRTMLEWLEHPQSRPIVEQVEVLIDTELEEYPWEDAYHEGAPRLSFITKVSTAYLRICPYILIGLVKARRDN